MRGFLDWFRRRKHGDPQLSLEEVREMFQPWRDLNSLSAWRAITNGTETDPLASKFGGLPYLPDGTWPTCPGCHEPMQLFVQLNLATLPESSTAYATDGMIQLFYCVGTEAEDLCEMSIENFQAFSPGKVCRFIETLPRSAEFPSPPPRFRPYECENLVRWEEFADYPNSEAFKRLGLSIEFDVSRKFINAKVEWPVGNIKLNNWRKKRYDFNTDLVSPISQAAEGSKLGGWPLWIQNEEYPTCPQCSSEMTYLLQIDSEDQVRYVFGDYGCGRLFQCPKHADILTFAWDSS